MYYKDLIIAFSDPDQVIKSNPKEQTQSHTAESVSIF